MNLKEILKNIIFEGVGDKMPDPCNSLTEGKMFCKNLQKVLSKGTGGKGAKTLQGLSFRKFRNLRNGDYLSLGDKVVLEPGNVHYEKRIDDMFKLLDVLKNNNSCRRITNLIESDIEKLKNKKITMRIDDKNEYSLFNRINTHSTNQAFILTKLIQSLNTEVDSTNKSLNDYSNDEMINRVLEVLNYNDIDNKLDEIMSDLIRDENSQQQMMSAFNFSRDRGYKVETEAQEVLSKQGFEVIPFSDDFGFVDYFGIDMIVVDDKGAHPVQVSSQMKRSPKIFQYEDSDCKPFALFKSNNKFIKYYSVV
jgi:hypothetical protein